MFTPIRTQPEMSCPNAPRKTRIINNVNNVENLVSKNLYNIFISYRNVTCTPTKVRVHVKRDYMEPVRLFN